MKIKEILTIDLSEDIKNVIDLEDISEVEIQSEIENYIITEGLAKEYDNFIATYLSNKKETGVWLSGFYGSGKSYFGKMLGYLLSNRKICGTPARDRILQRFTGIKDDLLVKNSIAKLNSTNNRVVFLDIAKQNTEKGLAYALFRNFLKSLDLPENEHGILLYNLMLQEKNMDVHAFVSNSLQKNWNESKSKLLEYSKVIKTIFMQKGNSEIDFDTIFTSIKNDINQFSSSRLKEELSNYLLINKGEKIVFLFDEASEAINNKKFTLLDLEGLSEALTSLGSQVWTIAIAQEKLDDVINNFNISKAQLTKVTDRFKTKIHLEATEVDVIIRSRLLQKNQVGLEKLSENYQKYSGKITDHTMLSGMSISKTDTVESYITYYPFYQYQFTLMQDFLFGTKGYTSTKVAARGMIITTFEVLKRELQGEEIFDVATSYQINNQALPQPDFRLVHRFDTAERILIENKSTISGRNLLETINFLAETEEVPVTLINIIKAITKDPDEIYKIQPEIAKALTELVDKNVLLSTNNIYRITSDIEERMVEEMKRFTIQTYMKKKQFVAKIKSTQFVRSISQAAESTQPYNFYISTDNDDDLTSPQLKNLKIKIKSIYNLSDNRSSDIESLKVQYQNEKETIWLVPDNHNFKEIDRLIDDIERLTYLEQNHASPQPEEAMIIKSLMTIKAEKEKRLEELIDQSLQNSMAIYLFNLSQGSKDHWLTTIQSLQRQVIQNVYNRRLESQLSDTVALMVIKEVNDSRLMQLFHGKDFEFFDKQGVFIGENLKVTTEIKNKIQNSFVDGKTIEKELEQPPTGYQYGTVVSTISALMRAGKVIAKHNGNEYFSWKDPGVKDIFSSASNFRNASYKAIAKSLTAVQKNEIVKAMQELKCADHIGKKVDWNTNDFELVYTIRELAKRFLDKVDDMSRQTKDFTQIFSTLECEKENLANFTGTVNDVNYTDRAEVFLGSLEVYKHAIQSIEKAEQFIRDSLSKVLAWKIFIDGVRDELIKGSKTNTVIEHGSKEFDTLYKTDIVKNFATIQQTAQKLKDEYFKLMETTAKEMTEKYIQLKTNAETALKDIEGLPPGLNDSAIEQVKILIQYAKRRSPAKIDIDFDVKDKVTHFTYSEMLSSIEIYPLKLIELEKIREGLVKEEKPKEEFKNHDPRIIPIKLPERKLKVREFKKWLNQELQTLTTANDNDEIEIGE